MVFRRLSLTHLLRFLATVLLFAGSVGGSALHLAGVGAASGGVSGDQRIARHDDEDDDDEWEDDDDDDDDGGSAPQTNPASNAGQGQQDDDDDDSAGGRVIGADRRTDYRVTVNCELDDDRGETTCVFVAVAPTKSQVVIGLAVPESAMCAPVIGGDFAQPNRASDDDDDDDDGSSWYGTGSQWRGPALVSDDDVLTLLFEGSVVTRGEMTYWVGTGDDLFAVTGQALHCEDDATPSDDAESLPAVGSLVVQTFSCPFASATEKGAEDDWFVACSNPGRGATFSLTGLDSDLPVTREENVDDDGIVRIDDLPLGRYTLVQTDQNWCHAESDGVDDDGNVVIADDVRTTVWIFNCESAK